VSAVAVDVDTCTAAIDQTVATDGSIGEVVRRRVDRVGVREV
jgi:hypothetical protein